MQPKNIIAHRRDTKNDRAVITNISRTIVSDKDSKFIQRDDGLPEMITLPDGRIFTNQDIVSIKHKYKNTFDMENDNLWLEIEQFLIANGDISHTEKANKTKKLTRRISGTIKKKG